MDPTLGGMELVDRVRGLLPDAEEKRMFGGTGFMVDGALAVSVSPRGLLVRVGPDDQPALLGIDGVGPMTMRDRVSRGWVQVDADVLGEDDTLREWVERGVSRARAR